MSSKKERESTETGDSLLAFVAVLSFVCLAAGTYLVFGLAGFLFFVGIFLLLVANSIPEV